MRLSSQLFQAISKLTLWELWIPLIHSPPLKERPCTFKLNEAVGTTDGFSVLFIWSNLELPLYRKFPKYILNEMDFMHVTSHPPTRDLPDAAIGQS
ncbi:hypothetical protein AVEN_181189-1 [Araneus ventricosus]|uniref:Uncharacterized protein n=1 Tax=Araneus ventricosus TaxID=182803 RepID=A0A4Y2PFL7_ARAVE|nr:hypothetical protein AVEN_27128-1 [Araneus ventricosus]GBN36289.1 hypothetical protein AVEN_252191-1 [Araneus ventricosus]GBN50721.1 hypothetical protein AVEN_122714-1 [Araneus ventricosus]GBN50798.1 hypothetical protein AVEN_181189-1 [Araneus ventricosus]